MSGCGSHTAAYQTVGGGSIAGQAIITAGYLVFYSREIIIKVSASNMNQLLFKILCCLFVLEFIIGIFNVVLLTPILFQIIHLLFAHFVWITLTIFIFEGLKTRGIE